MVSNKKLGMICLTIALIGSWVFGIDHGITHTLIAMIGALAGYSVAKHEG